MKPALIGIHGVKRSGKDTAGLYLESIGYQLDSFAAPLRQFGYLSYGVTEENRENVIESLGITGRQILQLVGTEVARNIHQNFWINSLHFRNPLLHNVAITDVRFDNEAKFVKDNGGFILRVDRPSLAVGKDLHASEKGIDPKYVDEIIVNDGTLEEYITKLEQLMNRLTNTK